MTSGSDRPGETLPRTRIFTVPMGRPFLDCLAHALIKGNLPAAGGAPPGPIELAGTTLLLPTRRATRALQDAFLRAGGGRAMLLPSIRAIAERDEELSDLAAAALPDAFPEATADIPPAVPELERRLVLTSLVMRWSEAMRRGSGDGSGFETFPAAGASTPAQAASLAKELARLMDLVETEGASFADLAGLVPEEFSEHWQKTLSFLAIVTESWPELLAADGALSPADRRNRIMLAEAQRLAALPPEGPLIVAGVTGSIPATVELIRRVARLDKGAIVLPALDQELDEESWQRIVPEHPEHPQFGLKKLLDALGVARSDVQVLPGAEVDTEMQMRHRILAEAMRPAATTARWHAFMSEADATKSARLALAGISLVEAPTEQDEAEAIAYILRETLETPGRTAALVSRDRLLARRVAVRLETWGIRVDDSAGRPFAKTVPGAFLDLVVDAVAKRFPPAALMALLKHPLTRLGLDAFKARRAARAIEIAAMRGPYLDTGLDGAMAALDRARHDCQTRTGQRSHPATRALRAEDWDGARDLLSRLTDACRPLVEAFASAAPQPLSGLAALHVAAAERIAEPDPSERDLEGGEDKPVSPLWIKEAGQSARTFFESLTSRSLTELSIPPLDYADLYRSLIQGVNVRPLVPLHPRLFIWGPFEARLQQPDVIVLGSLNDGVWPEATDTGPWLNRPMREALGLPSPEEDIGRAAHDFVSLMGASQVVMTRAEKLGGVPAVPSRWLLRLRALLGGLGASDALSPKSAWLGWARARDHVAASERLAPPAPRPPVRLRPRKLSVSRIEAWIANPYAIFARDILRLEPMGGLGEPPGPSLRGSIIHEALSRFASAHPETLPDDIEDEVVRHARAVLETYAAHPRVAAFWGPRFERFATWLAETERDRRSGVLRVESEISGSLVIAAPAGPFTLTARADRIDVGAGGLVITDYKTGKPPTDARVTAGLAPQLPLEAAIALRLESAPGFERIPARPVTGMRYIRASGAEPPGEQRDVKVDDIRALAERQLEGLTRLVARFDDQRTPYSATRHPGLKYDFDPYAHLARFSEWSQQSDEEEGP